MIDTASKLYAFLDPRSRVQVGLLLLPMLVVALLEMLSIGLILPVIQVLLLDDVGGTWTQALLGLFPELPRERAALWVAGTFAALFVVKNALLLAQTYVINRVMYDTAARFTEHMYALYLARPLTYHFRRNSAEVVRDLVNGIGLSFGAMRLLLMMVLDILLMLAAFAILLLVEPVITAIVAAALLALGLAFYALAGPVFRHWGRREREIEGDLIRWINQTYASIRDLKLLHAIDFLKSTIASLASSRAGFQTRAATSMHIPRLLVETVVIVGFLVLVALLISFGKPPGELVATLGLYAMAALRLMPSLNRILTSAADLKERTAYVEGLYAELADTASEADLVSSARPWSPIEFRRDIRLDEVTYYYPDAVHHALYGVTVTIGRGQSAGFVGPSGAGKSTLVDIVLGLLRPQSGRLLIDGVDAFSNLQGWQRRIGYVPQEISLIDDTLRRNVAFALPDAEIDEVRLAQVVRLARLEEVVAELPDGLSTMLGERGVCLSGGQRQRVAIARALYRDPDVLVFDEATSALDSETEREITMAIETLAGERTVVIIAHRLSTVRNCDTLVFLKGGRVAGSGSFDELVRSNAEFRRLAEASGAIAPSDREPRNAAN